MTITTIGSREARQKWRDVLDAAHSGGVDTVIERNRKPVAALIPYEDYLAVEELLADLRAARRVAAVREILQQNPGQGRSYEEIRAELVKKELLDE
jgi:prevent-host-death family protein